MHPLQSAVLLRMWGTKLTREITADIISTVEFDHTGNYLATGDKGGRVVLFERNETVCDALGYTESKTPEQRLTVSEEKNM